jgi:hypothetical protein
MRAVHVPMEILRLKVKGENVGQQLSQGRRNFGDDFVGNIAPRFDPGVFPVSAGFLSSLHNSSLPFSLFFDAFVFSTRRNGLTTMAR